MKKLGIASVVGIVFILSLVFGFGRFGSGPDIDLLESARAERGDLRAVLVETGIIQPQVGAQIKIGARATGVIEAMNVRIGDQVKKGALIALIDDREIVRQIEQEKAALAAARTTLQQVKLTYPQQIKEAEADHEYKRLNYARKIKLIDREFTSQDEVDLARSQIDGAAAKLARLKEEYRTQTEVTQAHVAEIEAQLKVLEIRQSYTRIYAPIDGIVSDITIQEGETIVTGLQVANLVTILDPTRLELWIYVDETDVGRVTVGQPVEYYVDTYPERLFFGTVDKIYYQPIVKDNIVYYPAIMLVKEEDAAYLRPEMTAYVRLIYEEQKNVLMIPNAAIKFEKGNQVVYRVNGPKDIEQVAVKIGVRGEDYSEVKSGIEEGDMVATKLILPAAKDKKAGNNPH